MPIHTKPDAFGPNGKLSRINYKETMERIARLKKLVKNVSYIWECAIDEELRVSAEMKEFFSDCQTKGRIDPRDAV
jgi:G:T-mismatch repair DNA endonuclease (very short patch repair protein)